MDLLESGDEREVRPLGQRLRFLLAARLPAWAVAGTAVLVLGTLGSGLVGAVQVAREQAREAARVEVDVLPAGSSSSTVRGVARGQIELLLVNRRERQVRLGELRVEVPGLRVLRTDPALDRPLGAFEERLLRIAFTVPSCDELALPGVLSVSLLGEDQPLQRRELSVTRPQEPAAEAGISLGACPPSARGPDAGTPTDIGVRPAGGVARRVGDGAEGFVRLEVRNGGQPVRLLGLDARVPGAVFTPRVLEGGRTLEIDGLVLVRLAFRVEECSRLRPSGWVVLRVARSGDVQELGLRITAEPAAGLGPQVRLPVVTDACD